MLRRIQRTWNYFKSKFIRVCRFERYNVSNQCTKRNTIFSLYKFCFALPSNSAQKTFKKWIFKRFSKLQLYFLFNYTTPSNETWNGKKINFSLTSIFTTNRYYLELRRILENCMTRHVEGMYIFFNRFYYYKRPTWNPWYPEAVNCWNDRHLFPDPHYISMELCTKKRQISKFTHQSNASIFTIMDLINSSGRLWSKNHPNYR